MYVFYIKDSKANGKSIAWIKKHKTEVYNHWKKWAGAKNYVAWKQIWAIWAKKNQC